MRLMAFTVAGIALAWAAACADGSDGREPFGGDGSIEPDRSITFRDLGPLSEFGPPDTAPPNVPDADKDGHCRPGTTAPPGVVCKTKLDCDDTKADVYPDAPETCDNVGVDNDCDADKDEVDLDRDGKSELGVACVTTLPGVCAAGKRACSKATPSALICAPVVAVGAQKETCNGKDDDCNGTVDDRSNALCANSNQCMGAKGCQCRGKAACLGGNICCSGGCAAIDRDRGNCGACGVPCGDGETCDSSRCKCGTSTGPVAAGRVCPKACSAGTCCDPVFNVARIAVARSSGGGTTALGFGPERMNDAAGEAQCKYHWVTAPNTTTVTGGKWIELRWTTSVAIGRIEIDTLRYNVKCAATVGRALGGGQLQYLKGTSWVTIATITGKDDDWAFNFAPVLTTALRLFNVHVSPKSASKSHPVIFEWQAGCR